MSEIYEHVTQYSVSALPEGLSVDSYIWGLHVTYRGEGLWSVDHLGMVLAANNKWDYDRINSSRTDYWRSRHRFPLEEALKRAREMAPKMVINGFTVADLLKKYGVEE